MAKAKKSKISPELADHLVRKIELYEASEMNHVPGGEGLFRCACRFDKDGKAVMVCQRHLHLETAYDQFPVTRDGEPVRMGEFIWWIDPRHMEPLHFLVVGVRQTVPDRWKNGYGTYIQIWADHHQYPWHDIPADCCYSKQTTCQAAIDKMMKDEINAKRRVRARARRKK